MTLRIGIDIAVRAPHQATLADERGKLIWSGHRFRTTAADLDKLWQRLPADTDPSQVTIVMEPTRNAWVPLAAWFRRHRANVVLVSAERSADLRAYYAKHTESDRLDSVLLARLPLLHPEGVHAERGLGPGDPLRRSTKLHSTLVKRRTTSLARLDALLEIFGPDWHAAFRGDLANRTPLRFLAAGYADPHTVKRLGRSRLTRFFQRHSRGAWGESEADTIIAAAKATLELWGDELEFADLADDIAIEARLALTLTQEIKELDERIAVLVAERDPEGILASVPGVGAVTSAVILGRLGDANRFTSLAAVRSFSGLVPSLDSSGVSGRHGGPTKRRDALLREALFLSANQARRYDPTLAAKYHRLMVHAGKPPPQLSAVPQRHHTADPHRLMLEEPNALPTARRRRAPGRPRRSPSDHRRPRRSPSDHRRPLPDPRNTSAEDAPPPPNTQGRTGEVRSHGVLHRPTRPTPTLGDQEPLDWNIHYNCHRPHSAAGGRPPAPGLKTGATNLRSSYT